MNEEKAICVTPIVMPAVTAVQAVEAFNAYQELASKILKPEDIQNIQGKEFKRKSFWRKCQRFFNLSVEILSEHREEVAGIFIYKFVVRAIAPNGAYVDGTGACASNEKGLIKTEHNTRAIAETRAKNRAIADLVAFGEVSAEEIEPNGDIPHQENGNPNPAPRQGKTITEPQQKRIFAKMKAAGKTLDQLKEYMKTIHGIEHTEDITMGDVYDDICGWIDQPLDI